jgi:hypothetical protein
MTGTDLYALETGAGETPYTLTLAIRIRADNVLFCEIWLIWRDISHTIPVVYGNSPPPLKKIVITGISLETDNLGA